MSPISQTSLFSVYLFSRASHQYKWQMKVRNSARASVSTVKWTSKKTRKKDDVFFFDRRMQITQVYLHKKKQNTLHAKLAQKYNKSITEWMTDPSDRWCVCVYVFFPRSSSLSLYLGGWHSEETLHKGKQWKHLEAQKRCLFICCTS